MIFRWRFFYGDIFFSPLVFAKSYFFVPKIFFLRIWRQWRSVARTLPGRLYGNYNFYINDIRREVIREYKYLGIVCSINGKFSAALSDLMNRGQKAYFKFCSLFKNASSSVRTTVDPLYNDTLYNRKPLYNVS